MSAPQRMARLWILLVVAYAWMLLVRTAVLLSDGALQKNVMLTALMCGVGASFGKGDVPS